MEEDIYFPFLHGARDFYNTPIKNNRALDLFSGTGSVGLHLQKMGFEVTSLDISKVGDPTLVQDITKWDYTTYPPRYFRLIAAGVPCTEYSRAKTVGDRDLQHADGIALKTMEIIQYFQPEIWWIENPRGGMLKDRSFMRDIPYIDVDYCQFADWGYQKPTRLWCCKKISELPHKICDHRTCRNLITTWYGSIQHRERLGGNNIKFSTRSKYRTPSSLVEYLLSPYTLPNKSFAGWEHVNPRGQPPPPAAQPQGEKIVIPERLRAPKAHYPIRFARQMENELQLVLELKTELEGGERRNLKVLVDTGAEANLIRTGLVPKRFTRPAHKVLELVAVNGQVLQGGKTTADVKVYFTQEVNGEIQGKELDFNVTFWEADIEVDAILSHPWLFENKIGVFPHHKALAVDRPRFTLLYGILPKCRPRRTRNRDADSICTSVQAFPTHQFKVFRKWADRKWVGSSDQNESLTEMLEVGAVNEDMDMPPLESAEGGPNSPGHEGAAQQHTSSGALTEGNGEGLPGWQATAQRTHASPQSDKLDAAHSNELNIERELKSVLSYISFYEDECVTDNELRIWLNEKLIELSTQILNDKEQKIWDQIRITCALEPMHPHRTQESAESSSSSNGSSLKELTDKSDNGCGVEGPDHRTRNKSTPSGERTRIGSGGRQELIGTETSAQTSPTQP